MNSRNLVSMMGVLACMALTSACGSQRINGTIEVTEGHSVRLIDEKHQEVEIRDGIASLDLTWALGFQNELQVRVAGRLVKIPISRESYLGGENFYVSAGSSKQPVDIHAVRTIGHLGSSRNQRYEGCAGPGVCPVSDDLGVLHYHVRPDCTGSYLAEFETSSFADQYVVKLLPPGSNTSGTAVATFVGQGNYRQSERFVASLSACTVPEVSAVNVVLHNADADRRRTRIIAERRAREAGRAPGQKNPPAQRL